MRVEVVTGCMFSGKSEELIRRLRREVIAKRTVLAFKPAIDNRYDETSVASHGGLRFPCFSIGDVAAIRMKLRDAPVPDVVGIDEAQFFDQDIVNLVQELAARGCRVIIAGLDLDADGVPFGSMPFLLAEADVVLKLTAVCTVCGEEATRSRHMQGKATQVEVGADQYEARCRSHWR